MFELIFEIVAWPVIGLLQATVGVLWPSADAEIRRLQRWTLVFALAGITAFVAALVIFFFAALGHILIGVLIISYVLLVLSGILGRRIEKTCQGTSADSN